MKPVLALFVAAFVAMGGEERSEVHEMRSAAAGVAHLIAEVEQRPAANPVVVPVQKPVASKSTASVHLDKAVRVPRGRRVIDIPVDCRNAQGNYDVVVHFHGAPTTIQPIFAQSGVNAVFVLVNLGIGSGPYENAFSQDGSLAALLTDVDKQMQKYCPAKSGGALGRVALSAWSAGYGAVYRVLGNKTDKNLVDSVLLSDGLHAGFLDKYRQHINALQMEPFDAFAEKAVKGEKLFAITHTSIKTTYASTTETAGFLIHERGLEKKTVSEQGPRPTMQLVSKADGGNFHVRGFAGGDTHAHCDHLYAMGETLYPMLRDRWAH
jgi:hypothetical protein